MPVRFLSTISLTTKVLVGVAVATTAVVSTVVFYELDPLNLRQPNQETPNATGDEIDRTPFVQKVLVIVYDVHHNNGLPYYDPTQLTYELEAQLEDASRFHGYDNPSAPQEVDIQFHNFIYYNTPSPIDPYGQREKNADYIRIFEEHNICDLVEQGNVDEVWLWADRTGDYYESTLVGPRNGSFWVNGRPILNEDCPKQVPVMGFNYEREVDMALHNFGHRMEYIFSWKLDRRYPGTPSPTQQERNWYEFTGIETGEHNQISVNHGYCGVTHYAPNCPVGSPDYSYLCEGSTMLSDCEDWNPQHTGQKTEISCDRWDCNETRFYIWWFQNLPGRCNGMTKTQGGPMPNLWWLMFKIHELPPDWGCGRCIPDCEDVECGDDGCGGSCGECEDVGKKCHEFHGLCVPICDMDTFKACTSDSDCIKTYGSCCSCVLGGREESVNIVTKTPYLKCLDCPPPEYLECVGANMCSAKIAYCNESNQCDLRLPEQTCTPDCSGKECGPDGCGGICGTCGTMKNCDQYGQCYANCFLNCTGPECEVLEEYWECDTGEYEEYEE